MILLRGSRPRRSIDDAQKTEAQPLTGVQSQGGPGGHQGRTAPHHDRREVRRTPNQITKWKRQLLDGAAAVFGEAEQAKEGGPSIAELHAKIGELTMENDFLSGALGRMGGASAKR